MSDLFFESSLPFDSDSRCLRLTIAPDLEQVAEVRRFLERVAASTPLSRSRTYDLKLVASEAVANAMEHATAEGDIEIVAWLLFDRIIIEITNPGAFQPGLNKDSEGNRRGLGLPLMVSLADQVHVSQLPEGKTQVSLTFLLDAAIQRPQPGLAATPLSARATEAEDKWPGRVARWAWLAIPILIGLVIVFRALGLRAVHEDAVLFAALNALFLAASSFIIAYLAARDYEKSGSPSLLALGSAALTFGLAYLLGGMLVTSPNAAVTIHNVGFLVAGAGFVLSALWALGEKPRKTEPTERHRHLYLFYGGVLVFMALLAAAALGGVTPSFFITGQGYTWLREIVLGLGVVELLAASLLYRRLYSRLPSRFLQWCYSGLGLIAVSMASSLLPSAVPGSPLAWLVRSGLWLGGIYLLVAIFSLERESGTWALPLERALRESKNRYQTLVDLSPDAILVAVAGSCVFANPAAARLFRAPASAELLGKPLLELVHADDHDSLARRLSLASGGAVAPPQDTTFLRLDGTPVDVELTGARVEFEGQVAVQLVLRDISARKEAQAALQEITARKQAEEAAIRASQYNRSLIEAALDPLVTIGPDGKITDVNEATVKITGYAREELVGTDFSDYFTDPESARRGYLEVFAQGSVTDYPLTIRGRDGKLTDVLYNASVYKDEAGRVLGVFAAARDITALRELEVQRSIADTLQQALLSVPETLPGLAFGHLHRSATENVEVGGDFYDLFLLPGNHLGIILGDVSGRGIEAANMAALVKNTLKAYAHRRGSPARVLADTNHMLIESTGEEQFVTAFFGLLDLDTGELKFSSAGHPPPALRGANGEVRLLTDAGPVLGLFPDAHYPDTQATLDPGDLLVLYTDGLTEARRDGQMFGERGLLEFLTTAGAVSTAEIPEGLLQEALAFTGGALRDDFAVLALERLGK